MNLPPTVHLSKKSGNAKTGPIPVTTSGRSTCPDTCPLKGKGCFGENYHLRMHWDKVSGAERGTTFDGLCEKIAAMPEKTLWRHNQVGDLPGDNLHIDGALLGKLSKANQGRRGFTYTHKPVLDDQPGPVKSNRDAIAKANRDGFTVNLSGNSMSHADRLAALNIAPVVAILPDESTENRTTPAGRRVVVCPAQVKDGVTCSTCGLCQRASREYIIGFLPHGGGKKHVARIAASFQ
jgi:hypothetical protein